MPATLEALPTELKSRIAKISSQSDRNWTESKAAIAARKDAHRRMLDAISSDTVHGKSLEALSRVSKVWREICAPLIFHTVDLTDDPSPIFTFNIAPQFSKHFTSATILSPIEGEQLLLHAVDILMRLPRIVNLTLEPGLLLEAFRTETWPPVFDDDDHRHSNLPPIWNALITVLARMELVNLKAVSSMALVDSLASICPNLRHLTVEWAEMNFEESDGTPSTTHLLSGLVKWQSLRSLRLTSILSQPAGILDLSLPPLSNGDDSNSAPLETLSLCADSLHPSWFAFASQFSRSLIDLSFEATSNKDRLFAPASTPPFELSTASFPHLARLRICAFRSITGPILLSAKRTNFPSLRDLDLGMHFFSHRLVAELQLPGDEELMNHAKSLLEGESRLRIFDSYMCLDSATISRAHALRIRTEPVPSFPFESLVEEEDLPKQMRCDLPKSVTRTVNFLVQSVEQAKANRGKTNADWIRLAGVLREAELERVAMRC